MSLKLTFYGDDFSGSTDCLEALALAGLKARLYLKPPTSVPDGLDAVGIAGTGRTMNPTEMRRTLPSIFQALKALGAPRNHYKICSTFDSSPSVGSIGCVIDIGIRTFGAQTVPVVVGAPMLGRYVAFGNLFARVRADEPQTIQRLDRHPTMSRHPVTPMHESDLRLLLREQGLEATIGSINAPTLDGQLGDYSVQKAGEVVLFDTLTEAHLKTIGEILLSGEFPFIVGSSGVEYAFGLASGKPSVEIPSVSPVDRVLVASGSASPVTQKQLSWAESQGWRFAQLGSPRPNIDGIYTARGPDSILPGRGGEGLGTMLGEALIELLRSNPTVKRFIVCGGDTSGFVAKTLGVEALDFVACTAPGSPLCRIVGGEFDGYEVVFKGGQVGTEDFFGRVKQGA